MAESRMHGLDWLALAVMMLGGLNWALVGAFDFDLVATLFGPGTIVARILYILAGVAAIWGFAILRLARRAGMPG
jgi:uncharacterized protein